MLGGPLLVGGSEGKRPARWLGCLVLCLALVGVATLARIDPSAAQSIVPHRALYHMKLSEAQPSSGIIGAEGEMYFEWAAQCDGWVVNQHVELRLALGEQAATTIQMLFSGWEARDGTRMRFNMEHKTDGAVQEEIVGEAELGSAGGEARFTKPAEARLRLPAGTVFPTEYWVTMLKKLSAGDVVYTGSVFDGSTVEGTYEVTAFFGRPEQRAEIGAAESDAREEPVWPVRLAYFMHGQNHAEPVFEVGELINARGIAHSFDLDYGYFTVRAEIDRFEALTEPSC